MRSFVCTIANKSARNALAGAKSKLTTLRKRLGANWRRKMKARNVFMALMVGKGYTPEDLAWDGKKFVNSNITTRWNYFLLGWEMRGVM